MRNLRNVRHRHQNVASNALVSAIAWDVGNDELLYVSGPNAGSAVVSLGRWHQNGQKQIASGSGGKVEVELENIASWDAPCPLPNLDCDKVLCMHYFADLATTCIAFAGGDIVVIRDEAIGGQDKIEIVGSVDAGITAAEWSPDEELLALTTRDSTLLFMTRDFDGVTDVSMKSEDLDSSKHVSVGWGKSETQFKGKRAKALRDPTVPERLSEGKLSPFDEGEVAICWRADGAFVAVSSIQSEIRRVIRVYSRDSTLDSVSEPVDGLEASLSWRPSGNLIASTQRFEDHVDVVFFERNGLRHGQFSLRLSDADLSSRGKRFGLHWNIDSTVLAVSLEGAVQLWTIGNYHYYLKQEISLQDHLERLNFPVVRWHPEKPLNLAISSSNTLQRHEFVLAVAGGPTITPDDNGSIAVIDGRTIKYSPLRFCNVPPPMALHEIGTSSNVIDVSFSQHNLYLAALHDTSVEIFRLKTAKAQPEHGLDLPLSTEMLEDSGRPIQVSFLGNTLIFVLIATRNGSTLVRACFDRGRSTGFEIIRQSERAFVRIFARTDHQRLCVQTVEKDLYQLDQVECDVDTEQTRLLPSVLPWVETVMHKDKPITFGLSTNGILYADNKQLVRACTSFIMTSAHLVFTTSNHLLKFVHLAEVDSLDVPPDAPETDERCRSIERGARLVTVMPSSYSLALQMPRGNLETIYPRALVLAGVRQAITSKDYKKAFLACRNHRVDFNLLFDYAPEQFIQNVDLFLRQVSKVENVDLFLSALKEEDVSKTMYRETLPLESNAANPIPHDSAPATLETSIEATSKVNRICDSFLMALRPKFSTHVQNAITAHACKHPPDLDSALLLIGDIRKENEGLSDRAVEHLCFLADVNRLFDNALGLYKLDLALLIAQQSQKDPREYLVFLQDLQAMSDLRRQFTIDNHLKRFSKALGHLHDMKEFVELKQYVVTHKLYKEALDTYKYEQSYLNQLMEIYAEYLNAQARYKEAGIAYEFLANYDEASQAYRAGDCWQECLFCASFSSLTSEQVNDLAKALADTLYESKDYYHAARLYLDYRDDVEKAMESFCKANHFGEALRLGGLRQRHDLLERVIDPGLAEALASHTELLAECKNQLKAQVPRLKEVRTKREQDPIAYFGGDAAALNADANIPDNVSLAPTDASTAAGGTLFTRYSNRTSTSKATTARARRREERKRAKGKKGSVYEEEYLVNSVRRLLERVNATREDVKSLTEALMRRGMRERAKALNNGMMELVEMCQACRGEVFATPETEQDPDQPLEQIPPPPPMKAFEQLSL